MEFLASFRVTLIITSSLLFFLITRKLGGANLKGLTSFATGFGLIVLNTFFGSLFHGKFLSGIISHETLRVIGLLTGYIGLTIGLLLVLFGVFRIIRSLLPHLNDEFLMMFKNNPLPMLVYDLETLKFLEVNHALVEHYGYSREEFLAMTIIDIKPVEDLARLYENLKQPRMPRKSTKNWRHILKNGNIIDVDITSHSIKFAGQDAVLVVVQDVTEHKRAEQQLQESKRWNMELVDSLDGVVYEADANSFQFTFVSKRTLQIFGYTREQWMKEVTWQKLIHPEDQAHVFDYCVRAVKEGRNHSLDYRALRSDGSVIWVRDIATVSLEIDRPVKIRGVLLDITQQKRTEEELLSTREQLKNIFDNLDHVFWSIDVTNFKVLQVSSACEKVYGVPCSKFMQDPLLWKQFIHPDDKAFVEVDEKEVLLGNNCSLQYRIINSRGELRWLDVHVRPVKDSFGKVIRIDGVTSDITDRRVMEEALEASEKRYRDYFEENLAGAYISTPEGKIVACNTAFARIFGFESVDEALNTDAAALYADSNDRTKFLDVLKKQRRLEYIEQVAKDRNGKVIHISKNAVGEFDKTAKLVHIKGYVLDNSERKKLEGQFRQTQKMESIGTLAGGIAHDFNNILAIILAYSANLEKSDVDKPTLATSAKAITTAVQRGASLVRQILTMARKKNVTSEPVNINSTIEELGKMLQQTFPKTIEIQLSLDKFNPCIDGDPTQLQQALLNLCVNARDAMENEGKIHVATQVVNASTLRASFPKVESEEYVQLSVADTGSGMDEETRSRIFEPFFTTKEKGKGTGLGLSVVYGIVQSHSGFINVESSPDKGTLFQLYFPVVHSSIKKQDSQNNESFIMPRGSETVLLVEDENLLLEMLDNLLSKQGFRVLTARDGQEAIEQFKLHNQEIALVVSDLGLPKISGIDAVARMQMVNPQLRTILASGYLEPTVQADFKKYGVKAFVQKPYIPFEVLAKIRQILDEPIAETIEN